VRCSQRDAGVIAARPATVRTGQAAAHVGTPPRRIPFTDTVATTSCDDETARSATVRRDVRRYEILDARADAAFDDIAELAATVVGPPIATVSVVYADLAPGPTIGPRIEVRRLRRT
jgi:hypothetical protein